MGHTYERIGSGRLKDLIEFFLEDWEDCCVESALSFNTCGLLDSIAGAFEGAMFEKIINGVVTEIWEANLGDVWEQAVEMLQEPGLGGGCETKEGGE